MNEKQLKRIIKEEIENVLKEEEQGVSPNVKKATQEWNQIKQLAIGRNSSIPLALIPDDELVNDWIKFFNGGQVSYNVYAAVANALNQKSKS